MALLNDNILIDSLIGNIGRRLVFRKRKGQVIVSKWPVRKAPFSEAQKKQSFRFKEAVAYAKTILKNEEMRKGYEKAAEKSASLATAFNIAISDYMISPVLHKVDLTGYGGNVGDAIRIIATDNFAVSGISIEIYMNDGLLLEAGTATDTCNGQTWLYNAQSENLSPKGGRLIVRVSDIPGNVTVKEEII